MDKNKIITIVIAVIGMLVLLCGLSLLVAFPVKWTWNYVMPYLFDLKTISWGQAWCLAFLCGYLLKSSNTNNCNGK